MGLNAPLQLGVAQQHIWFTWLTNLSNWVKSIKQIFDGTISTFSILSLTFLWGVGTYIHLVDELVQLGQVHEANIWWNNFYIFLYSDLSLRGWNIHSLGWWTCPNGSSPWSKYLMEQFLHFLYSLTFLWGVGTYREPSLLSIVTLRLSVPSSLDIGVF